MDQPRPDHTLAILRVCSSKARGKVPNFHEGEAHPTKKNTHPNKNTIFANNFGTISTNVPTFPFKISRKQTERVCANSLSKLFYLGGWFLGWFHLVET